MELRFCSWCGDRFDPATAQVLEDGSWRCGHCARVTVVLSGKETVQQCQHCHTLFEAGAHFCPMCAEPPQIIPAFPTREQGTLPRPVKPLWPVNSWTGHGEQGQVAPPCPVCQGKVRPDGAGTHHYPGTASPPWNAGWDGNCATCGAEISLIIEQRGYFPAARTVHIRPAERFHQTSPSEATVFSGVEIEVTQTDFPGELPSVSTVFLSMGELMTLVQKLQSGSHPWLVQRDWQADWTQ